MFLPRSLLALLGCIAVVSFAGCGDGGVAAVDLVPVKPSPDIAGPVGFCDRDEQGLIVTVKNQGNKDANAAPVRVDFSPGGASAITDLGGVPTGGSRSGTFPIPSECWNPDCEFKIVVDPKNTVAESNEANNTAEGRCIG